MNEKLTDYLNNLLPRALLAYQFIEESLRECLYRQHMIAHQRLKGLLSYNAPMASIQNAAMGKLIQYFQVFSDDKTLLKTLNEVKARRGYLVHQGYLLSSQEQTHEVAIEARRNEIQDDLRKAKECLDAMYAEMNRLQGLIDNADKPTQKT